MVYSYTCEKCNKEVEIIKSMHESRRAEYCEKCKQELTRLFNSNVYFSKTKVENAEYNPAFGKVIRNSRHRRYEAEKRGWVEVGNDYKSGESQQKDFEKKKKEQLNKVWEDN